MCGGGGSSGEDPVKYQREQEQERQKRIEQGKSQLERIFAGLEGAEYRAVNPVAQMGRGAYADQVRQALQGNVDSYQDAYQVTQPKLHRNHPNQAIETVTKYRTRERLNSAGQDALRQLGLRGNQIGSTDVGDYLGMYDRIASRPGTYRRFEGVNDPIWQQQQEAYLDYAKPQLEEQYGDAQDQLTFALSRQGQSRGSLAGDRKADLNRDYDLRRQEVADKARGVANQARSDIASQKQSLLQMLSASADPGATATAARSAVSSLQSTPEFSPLGPLFQNATAGLAQGMAGYQNQKMMDQVQGIQYGRDPDRGSGRVIR